LLLIQENLRTTGKPSSKKANNSKTILVNSDLSDVEEETQNSDNHTDDEEVEMDVTQSYYHTDTSLLSVDRVNPGTEVCADYKIKHFNWVF